MPLCTLKLQTTILDNLAANLTFFQNFQAVQIPYLDCLQNILNLNTNSIIYV